jgi:hypothetical protein
MYIPPFLENSNLKKKTSKKGEEDSGPWFSVLASPSQQESSP